jgi:bifunctional non-homologous end joining protein LigD
VALILRDVLAELGLDSFVKVSGSKGLQVYVPLNTAVTYEQTQPLAKALAELLAQREPKLIVSQMAKAVRKKKVFIDWSQNTDFKTTIGVYSLRAKTHRPYVSLPLTWDELGSALKQNDAKRLYFRPEEALARVETVGDLFAPVLTKRQKLPREIVRSLEPRASVQVPATLKTYEQKRNFRKTAEPPPRAVSRSKQGSRRRFVVQKHAASHLHYDFRLEMHGVLKSWAIPKGPPFKEDERRLAMPTEDHPIDYLDFEGIIPKGQYGGGTVMVWDIGTYELLEGNYYRGFLRVYLNGSKMKGEWTLTQVRAAERGGWRIEKSGGNTRALSKKRDDTSALTGRSMMEIRTAADRQWQSNRS